MTEMQRARVERKLVVYEIISGNDNIMRAGDRSAATGFGQTGPAELISCLFIELTLSYARLRTAF